MVIRAVGTVTRANPPALIPDALPRLFHPILCVGKQKHLGSGDAARLIAVRLIGDNALKHGFPPRGCMSYFVHTW